MGERGEGLRKHKSVIAGGSRGWGVGVNAMARWRAGGEKAIRGIAS